MVEKINKRDFFIITFTLKDNKHEAEEQIIEILNDYK